MFPRLIRPVRVLRALPRVSVARSFHAGHISRVEMPNLDEEQVTELMKNPLVAKLSQSPKVVEKLKETTELLTKKGFTGDMGVVNQVKLMMDEEVREQLKAVNQLLLDEKIELRKEDMTALFKVMGLDKE